MNIIRQRALIRACIQFVSFSFIGTFLICMLFHAGALSFPLIAFMWTFWGFSVFTFIFSLEVKMRFKLTFAFLNLSIVALLLMFFITYEMENEKMMKVSQYCLIGLCVLYLIPVVLFLKNYFFPAVREIKKLFAPDETDQKSHEDCKTQYPVFLVHGTGFRDRKIFNYWSIIPALLREHGAQVFYSKHDAWSNVETSAEQIVSALEEALQKSGSEKVNVICHSKGGIDLRYAIGELGVQDKIASITMINSPNHGSKTVDVLYDIFGDGLFKFLSVFVNFWFRLLGDKKPDFYRTTTQFRASYMEEFNKKYPLAESIPTQSFAGKMKNPFSDITMFLLNIIISRVEGANDGLVTPDSARWGNFRGTIEGKGLTGISHAHEVDAYRSNPELKLHDGLPAGSKTVHDFYLGVVRELKEQGL